MAAASPKRETQDRAVAPHQDNEDETATPQDALVALEGNTYGLRVELKAMGAVWDGSARAWRIAPEKAAQAQALMDSQPEEPPKERADAAAGSGALDDLPDPFEDGPDPWVALTGNSFAVKDALRALGARWDKEQKAWVIKQSKAARAQALIDTMARGAPGEA